MVLFIHLLWPDQTYIQLYTVCLIFWCLSSVKSCFCFAISWLVYKWAKNCLLIPHRIMVVSFLGAGNSRNRISPLYYFLILLWGYFLFKVPACRASLHENQGPPFEENYIIAKLTCVISVIAGNIPHAHHETHLHTVKVATILVPSFHGLR